MIKIIPKYELLVTLLIGVVVLSVFGQTYSHELIGYDDPIFITLQPHVISGLSWENTKWAWRTTLMDIWHPVTWFSYQLESELFGPANDGARFLVNTCLHLLNAVLVYLVCIKLGFSVVHALLIALLFAVHPQHVEVVAWVSERKELLATCFVLLALWQYLIYQETLKKRNYLFSLLFFVVALLSKASAVPLAVLLPVLEVLSLRSNAQGKAISQPVLIGIFIRWLPFLMAALLVSVITIQLQGSSFTRQTDSLGLSVDYLLMMAVRFSWYLRMTFWPTPLSFFHPMPEAISTLQIVQSALLITIFLGVVWKYRTNCLFLVGMSWFVLFLAPTSGLIPVEAIYVSDRYSYQAHIGLFIALLAIVGRGSFEARARVVNAALFIVVAVYMAISFRQTAVWQDSITLFEHELIQNPSSDTSLVQLGYAYSVRENNELARDYYNRAIALNPNGFYGHAYLGFLEEQLGNHVEAEKLYRKAIDGVDPYKYHRVREIFEHLVWVSGTLQKHQQAIRYLKTGLVYFPESPYLSELKDYYQKYFPGLSKDIP